MLSEIESDDESALMQIEKKELIQSLGSALQSLDDDKRLLLRLAYDEQMPRRDIANMFGIPEGTVKTWLRRSVMQLRKALEEIDDVAMTLHSGA